MLAPHCDWPIMPVEAIFDEQGCGDRSLLLVVSSSPTSLRNLTMASSSDLSTTSERQACSVSERGRVLATEGLERIWRRECSGRLGRLRERRPLRKIGVLQSRVH